VDGLATRHEARVITALFPITGRLLRSLRTNFMRKPGVALLPATHRGGAQLCAQERGVSIRNS
jgi:hypothetical protein